MSIQSEIDRIANNVTNSLNKVAGKGVTVPADANSDDLPGLIEAIETGGGGGEPEEDWVGDGNTHIWISLEEGRTSPMLGVCPKGTVTVDWGDGTTPDVLTGTSTTSAKWTPRHNYAASGDYIITLTVNGEMGFYGLSGYGNGCGLLRYAYGNNARNFAYRSAIRRLEVGNGISSIGNYAVYYCISIKDVYIPDGVTSIGNYAFDECNSLASVHIPDGVTSIGASVFSDCYSLASVHVPDGVTSIGASVFQNCYSLESVHVPDGVTSIGANAFTNCYSLKKLRFDPTTPPTAAASSAFTNLSTDCIIIVPVGSLAAYTSATNYPNSATYTYIEED